MNRLRILLLTMMMMLMLPPRLLGQAYSRPQNDIYIMPVVCNDGTLSVFAARAFLNVWFGRQPWVIQGWYEVEPGKCSKIGLDNEHYSSGGLFGDDAVTLLAFAFFDSKGTWGSVKVPVGGAYETSNQQFCVQDGTFRYTKDSQQRDLARACDGSPVGYHLIAASVAFYGYSFRPEDPGERDFLHVRLGPNDRATPLGR